MRSVAAIIALLVGVAACGDDVADTVESTTAQPAGTTAPAATAPSTTPPGTAPETTAPAGTTTSVTAAPDIRELLGIEAIQLDAVGGGELRPVLSWAPVDAAERYALVVLDADGEPYWAWAGSDASIRFGGNGELANGQVAILHEPMTWRVAAFDDAGRLVAQSDAGTLQP